MANAPFRMTLQTMLVLQVLLTEPTREVYGLEICEAAGLRSGSIHPILARLEAAAWLTSHWEDIDPKVEGRPRRRYYQLTSDGVEQARYAIANARGATARLVALRPQIDGGAW